MALYKILCEVFSDRCFAQGLVVCVSTGKKLEEI